MNITKQIWVVCKQIIYYMKVKKRWFFLYFLVNILLVGLEYLSPKAYQLFIDNVLINGDLHIMKNVIFIYCIYFTVKIVCKYLKEYWGYIINLEIVRKAKAKIFSNYLQQDFRYYDANDSGDIQINIEKDTEFLKNFAEQYMVNLMLNALSLILAVYFSCTLSIELTFFALFTIPLTIYADKFVAYREEKLTEKIRFNDSNIVTMLNNALTNWKEVKTLCAERRIKRNYLKLLHEHIILNAQKIYFFVVRCLIIPWIREKFFMQIMLYFVGGVLVIYNRLSVGELLVFVIYYGLMSNAISILSNAYAEFSIKRNIIERVLVQMQFEDMEKGVIPSKETGEIVFDNVSFGYEDEGPCVLKNINLVIKDGDRIVLCGKSGCGKSTIAKLIAGMYAPTGGKLSFLGNPVQGLPPGYLYKKLGYIRQNSKLFSMSIKDNMLLGNPDATDQEIDKACKQALIYDYIQSLPEKYETILDENSANVSGGIKQRLLLARLFLKDAHVYIFDEATSNLDNVSNDNISQIITNMDEDKIVIYITHQKRNVCSFTRELWIEEGRIKEQYLDSFNNF